MIEKEAQEYINSLPKYGTKEYNERRQELEDRGFNENYNPNYWEGSYLDRRECEEREYELEHDDDEWEDEEYDRG